MMYELSNGTTDILADSSGKIYIGVKVIGTIPIGFTLSLKMANGDTYDLTTSFMESSLPNTFDDRTCFADYTANFENEPSAPLCLPICNYYIDGSYSGTLCSASQCLISCTTPPGITCPNGKIDGKETCDNPTHYGCTAECTVNP